MSFRSARKKAGLTQIQAAKKLGVSVAAVSLWDCGTNKPNLKKLALIADTYGCTIEELLKEN